MPRRDRRSALSSIPRISSVRCWSGASCYEPAPDLATLLARDLEIAVGLGAVISCSDPFRWTCRRIGLRLLHGHSCRSVTLYPITLRRHTARQTHRARDQQRQKFQHGHGVLLPTSNTGRKILLAVPAAFARIARNPVMPIVRPDAAEIVTGT